MNKTSQDIIKAWNKANNHNPRGRHIPKMTKADAIHKYKQVKKAVTKEGKRRSFEFFYNSSINCYRYLCDTTLMSEERYIWRLVHLFAMIVAAYVVWVSASSSVNNFMGISQMPDGIPLTQIPYPAVAICPLNLLSKRRVEEYAKKIIADRSDLSENDTIAEEKHLIRLLGYLGLTYDNLEPPNNELDELHELLNTYDLRKVIESLVPQCKDMIVRCMWRGQVVNCTKLFRQRKSTSGFCCTFNYIRAGDVSTGIKYNKSDAIMAMYGQEYGLSVIANPELEDYFYTRMPNVGFRVMIFNPIDYPDSSTGGSLEMYVAPMAEQYFSMKATVLQASKILTELPVSIRKCITMTDPFPYDTNSDCYLTCKVTNIYATCGCVPFYLPNSKYRYCDLQDEECLRRWKNTWSNAWLNDEAEQEDENGNLINGEIEPPCDCLPSCADVKYNVQKYSNVLQPEALNSRNDSLKPPLKRQVVFKDHSIIHIFFAKNTFILLQNDILFFWYDWLSNIGGLCGLVLGSSLLSIAEIIYFFVFGGPVKESHQREPPARKLYWQELRKM